MSARETNVLKDHYFYLNHHPPNFEVFFADNYMPYSSGPKISHSTNVFFLERDNNSLIDKINPEKALKVKWLKLTVRQTKLSDAQ